MHQVFIKQVKLAVRRDWPLIVHERGALEDTMCILYEHLPRHHPVCVHSFSGNVKQLHSFVSWWHRGYISIAGCVTYPSARASHALAREVPLDRLLLETDGPYMPPSPYRGEIAHPGHI